MSLKDGNLIPVPIPLSPNSVDFLSTSITEFSDYPLTVPAVGVSDDPISASLIDNLPITNERKTLQEGTLIPSFVDDWYNRIHLFPKVLNFGAVLGEVSNEVILWNAYFESKTLLSIVEENGDQFDIDASAPYSFMELEFITITVTIPVTGLARFTGTSEFIFSSESVTLTIIAIRTVPFAFIPLVPNQEKLKFKTDLIPGKNKRAEQRICIRSTPRHEFIFSIYLEDEQRQAQVDNLLFIAQRGVWGYPNWSQYVEHIGTLSSGSTTINIDTTQSAFQDNGGYAYVYSDPDNYEIVVITSVTDTDLTLDDPLQNTYTGTKWIIPALLCYLSKPTKRNSHPDGFAIYDFNMLAYNTRLLSGYVADETYNSKTVLTKATYVEPSQEIQDDEDAEVFDTETGLLTKYTDAEANLITQSHLFKNFTREDCWNFLLFLHDIKGRQGTVWCPTFKDDFILNTAMGPADDFMVINNKGYVDYMGLNNLRTHVAFMFSDGTNYYREIIGMVAIDASTERINLDSALGISINPGDCQISFLDLVRSASDEITIDWEDCFQNKCSLNFTKVIA